jgi:fatty-acyl-CoA synthase
VIIYTSGTTGVPKGCVLSHRGWTNNARLSAEVAGLTEDDVIMAPSPLFHLFGSLTGFMGALAVGARFVTLTTFDANRCASEMAATGATHLTAVPTMWLDLMGVCEPGRLPALRGGVWGGAGFPRAALERAIDPAAYGWSLQGIYGMTEAPTLTQVRPDDVPARKLDTVGRATPGVEVCIFDPARDEPVDAGQVGEVRARGYNQMLGYLGDEEASRARVMDGWVRTGDLGMLDSEGYLTVVGRITDVIITGGANVYAREVEDVVLEVQGVALAAVVAGPDERLGEVPVAWVQPEAGASLDPEAVRSHCAKNLASYKVPRRILAMESLPLTAGGKVHRARLRELSAQGSALGARR